MTVPEPPPAVARPGANRAGFLAFERQRRALAARLHRDHRRRRDRYRDLILITKLIRFEYEHLVGRVSRRARPSSLPDEPTALGGDTPADWAEPWGAGPILELRAELIHFSRERDRLAGRLSAPARARAAAEAERHLDRIRISSRYVPPATEKQEAQPLIAEVGGNESTAEDVRPWASVLVTSAAAIAAAVFLVAGIDAGIKFGLQSGGHPDSARAPNHTIANVPERPLPTLGDRSPQAQPPRVQEQRGASRRSQDSEQLPSEAGGDAARAGGHAVPTPSEAPAPTPQPVPEAATIPVSAPAPAGPAVATASAAPAPGPEQEFGFEP